MTYLCTNWVSQSVLDAIDRLKHEIVFHARKLWTHFFSVVLTISVRVKTQHIVLIPYLCVCFCMLFCVHVKIFVQVFLFLRRHCNRSHGLDFTQCSRLIWLRMLPDSFYLSFSNGIVWKKLTKHNWMKCGGYGNAKPHHAGIWHIIQSEDGKKRTSTTTTATSTENRQIQTMKGN